MLAGGTMTEEAIVIFNEYLSNAKAIFLDINTIDLDAVISNYFRGEPPFGEAHKKSEFPDAFNASMLRQYANKNGKVYVVSGDGDFLNISNVFCFKTLGELLDAVNSQDEICSKVKEYLEETSVSQRLYNTVESELMDKGHELEVDGTDTDRKGISSGYEYDEIELLSASPITFSDVEVIGIDYDDKLITISAEYKTKLEFSCSFFDEDNSIWDSEDKEFASSYYGTMHEIHNAAIPIEITVSFKDTTFDIDDIDVNIDIELNQYTLQKNGRNRIDDPYSYWDDDKKVVNNPCPNCDHEIIAKPVDNGLP